LWNIRTRTLIYTFESHAPYVGPLGADQPNDDDDDRDHQPSQQLIPAGVTAIEQSPAPDVVAVGFTNGFISIVNVKYDKQLFRFKAEAGGRVRSLSFRTDVASEQTPYLASGHDDGRIFVWHLLHRRLQFCMEDAHSAAIGTVKFMEGEPILLTNSADNSIKCWIFDAPDGSARLLRGRSGHSAHPRKIQYYGGHTMESLRDNATAMSCDIVSAGSDGTLRLFNHAREVQNMEYSQKQLLKKLGVRYRNASLPPIRNFALCETRGRDWGTIVTIHDGHSDAYVWKHKQK
jgi:U3 small nucleolar RNA-associated protein 21